MPAWLDARSSQIGPERTILLMRVPGPGRVEADLSSFRVWRDVVPPVHQVAIYPIAGTDTDTSSYRENENVKPLDKVMMVWFLDKHLRGPEDGRGPLADLVDAPDLARLPPTTIGTDEIDPLRSEGQRLAERLRAAGVPVEAGNYEGITHEFFGTALLVADVKAAQEFVNGRLLPGPGKLRASGYGADIGQ